MSIVNNWCHYIKVEEPNLDAEMFVNFVEKDLKINDPRRGLISIQLYDYQKRFIKDVLTHDKLIGTKFRQGGFTTIMSKFLLWKAVFKPNQNLLFVCGTDREARHHCEGLRSTISHNDALEDKISNYCNSHKIKFKNGSCVRFLGSYASLAGHELDHVYFDEAAYGKEFYNRYQELNPNCKLTVMSSTNKTQGWFYEIYKNPQGFYKFHCDIKEHPGMDDIERLEEMYKNLGPKGMLQEVYQMFLPI